MSTNDDAKRPSAVDLLRPAVRAMPGYTPGEQISDLVKLNTNEGAFPPSPRVMATLAAIADDSLRLYPDPVSPRLRAAAAARFGVAPDQVLAGNGSDDCLTILYRAFLDAGRPHRLPVADLRALRHAGGAAGRRAGAGRLPAERPPLGAAAGSRPPAREDDHPREPEQPVGDAGARRRAAPPVRRRDRARSSSSTRRTSTSRWRRHRREHAAVPGAAPEPGRAAHVLEELQPGGRAPRAAVRGGAARRRADEGQGQLQRQRRHPGARRRGARGPQLPRGVRAPHAGPARAPGARAARRSAGRGPSRPPTSCCARSASAPRRCTARSRTRGCWCAGGRRPSCARSCASASAAPTRTTT